MDIASIHNLFLQCDTVSIDTRKILPNSLFVAIKGDNFDANTFAEEALTKGAKFVIIDNDSFYIDERTILVENSLVTLQHLAQYHRNYLQIPIVALTGSNGKTTTKELIHAVLSKKYNTKATVGNLNNHIGVPLTLLSFTKETEIGVVEMGANHKKEIEFLCSLATPDYGYITNFGKAHLEGFGGVQGVIEGKSEMFTYLSTANKMTFINLEDEIQVEKSKSLSSFSFGIDKSNADVDISAVSANPFVEVALGTIVITTHLIGLYNANNVNAAIAIGAYFKVPLEDIKCALENYVPENNRSQMVVKGSNEIILDAYNANPSSMAVAIDNFLQLEKPNKIMVLGDMFELGEDSSKEHSAIVERLQDEASVVCFFVGKAFYENNLKSKSGFYFFDTFDTFGEYLNLHPVVGSTLLIKGSRGMALEKTLQLL
ncbi:UDP-N-acetylmuramoyl-tripeptide--D-alanyl-D-alanine ligase [Flavobacterium sp. LM5]|uniref:UDP-N-acetylmuramoyl-tripeptide--D-alanyl-D- alanine ligase n=1 Tax=Flavobacterium sp. LM5 TaxID=1938610 RepID=UPI000993A9C6|nr:UDP-N-acetylmuramoyl-tripeptide--D-alanyl-D-alanine ligase [Flavobacterium sp. LM5]OOV26982.1 UDP-N-acetylmuramoyl-tripeptide--D-alanyl-D-alanine ligase [Flavobacterium sp. LM5]